MTKANMKVSTYSGKSSPITLKILNPEVAAKAASIALVYFSFHREESDIRFFIKVTCSYRYY